MTYLAYDIVMDLKGKLIKQLILSFTPLQDHRPRSQWVILLCGTVQPLLFGDITDNDVEIPTEMLEIHTHIHNRLEQKFRKITT